MNTEQIEVIDHKGNIIEISDRNTVYSQGKLHKSVHVIAFDQTLTKIYVQKRSSTKATWPGVYDLSVGETNKPGESYEDSAKRGLKEELNITEKINLLNLRDKYYQECFYSPYSLKVVVTLFAVKLKSSPQKDNDEVEDLQLLSIAKVNDLIKSYPDTCTPWFVTDWQYIYPKLETIISQLTIT